MNYAELITKAKNNDKDAWNELYKATANITYFTAFSLLKNREDMLQSRKDGGLNGILDGKCD